MPENGLFHLVAPYQPTGDQPQAIEKLVAGVRRGDKEQTLLGVTGSGKTFTMANIIAQVQRPTLVLAHNKTLAAQLCSEFREFFPDSAVEFFVSYYDYYQPEERILRKQIRILKRIPPSTMRSINCATPPPVPFPSAGMSSSYRVSAASIRWATRSTTGIW